MSDVATQLKIVSFVDQRGCPTLAQGAIGFFLHSKESQNRDLNSKLNKTMLFPIG